MRPHQGKPRHAKIRRCETNPDRDRGGLGRPWCGPQISWGLVHHQVAPYENSHKAHAARRLRLDCAFRSCRFALITNDPASNNGPPSSRRSLPRRLDGRPRGRQVLLPQRETSVGDELRGVQQRRQLLQHWRHLPVQRPLCLAQQKRISRCLHRSIMGERLCFAVR